MTRSPDSTCRAARTSNTYSRRDVLRLGLAAAGTSLAGQRPGETATRKALRGVFPIVQTPYTDTGAA